MVTSTDSSAPKTGRALLPGQRQPYSVSYCLGQGGVSLPAQERGGSCPGTFPAISASSAAMHTGGGRFDMQLCVDVLR